MNKIETNETVIKYPQFNYPKINSRWVRGDNKYTPEMGDYNGYTIIHITNIANTHKHHPPQIVYKGDNGHVWSLPAYEWPGNLIKEITHD